jgi:hypothetical protein
MYVGGTPEANINTGMIVQPGVSKTLIHNAPTINIKINGNEDDDGPFANGDHAHVILTLDVGSADNNPIKPDGESFSGTYKGVSTLCGASTRSSPPRAVTT